MLPTAAAWLASSEWQQQLEQLLVVRQPGEEDLAEVSARTVGMRGGAQRKTSLLCHAMHENPSLASRRVQLFASLTVRWDEAGVSVVGNGGLEAEEFGANLTMLIRGMDKVRGQAPCLLSMSCCALPALPC